MRLLTLLLILFVWAAGPAMAGPFEDAMAASTRGDYATAIMSLRPLADQGNAAAQFRFGVMYDNGWGVPQDRVQAVDWYSKAAAQGHAAAQFSLGVMYDNGEGVPQDHSQAVDWYRKAADQGYADAQVNLGVMYANGEGVPQDLAHGRTDRGLTPRSECRLLEVVSRNL